jgi:hypothetical protein
MLEARRVIYPDLPPRPLVTPGKLAGRREGWMLRYASLLDANEFTKFVILARNLSPFIVVLVDPQARSRRLDRPEPDGGQGEFTVGHPRASRRGAAVFSERFLPLNCESPN